MTKFRLSPHGFTMVELLASLGIGALALLTTVSLARTSYTYFQEANSAIDSSDNLSRGAFSLVQALTYAVNLQTTAGPVSNNINAATQGEILIKNFNSISSATGFTTVANFLRDGGEGVATPATGITTLQGTSLFYYNATRTTSGVLFINLGTKGAATSTMTPSYGNVFVDRLTEFQFDLPQTTNGVLTGIRVTLVGRNFASLEKSTWRWCPEADVLAAVTDCTPTTPYRDVKKVIFISFVNQAINTQNLWSSGTTRAPDRAHGLLYFFPLRMSYE